MKSWLVVLVMVSMFLALVSCGASPSTTKPEEGYYFLTVEKYRRIVMITEDGTLAIGINAGLYSEFAVDDDQKLLFVAGGSSSTVYNHSSGDFEFQKTLSLSLGYIFCGYGRIAVVRNATDDVDFYDYDGTFIKNVKFKDPADTRAQDVYGIFLDEDTFVLSDGGDHNVIKIRISDGSIEVLKHFDDNLGSIFKHGDSYYVVRGGSMIYKFNETTDPVLIASGLPSLVLGLYVDDNLIYFVSNGECGFYIYNMDTGKYMKKFDFNYPYSLYRISFRNP